MNLFKQLEKQLIVSCQALEDEPLHSSEIMGRMAIAAQQGGANGIRANSVVDIRAIKKEVDLPIIGIIKQDYDDSDVFITPTLKEIKALLAVGVDMIATDATDRARPKGEELTEIIDYVRIYGPNVKLMADVSTIQEAVAAEKLGFDCVSTTLVGYTKQSEGMDISHDNFKILKDMVQAVSIPVIAEGKIDTPEKATQALKNGAHFIVVGGAITRPQLITQTFADAVKGI